MKRRVLKWTLWGGGIALGLVLLFVLYNQIDEKADPAREFTWADLARDDYAEGNGYTLLWALPEPPGVDTGSPAVREKYLSLFDPARGAAKNVKNWDSQQRKEMAKPFIQATRRVFNPDNPGSDRMAQVLSHRAALLEMGAAVRPYLERYDALIAAPVFQEYITPNFDAPIPNLVVWLRLAKLAISESLLQASDGDWPGGANRLLAHLDFSRRAMAGSRALITRLVAVAIFRLNCQALASLLNQEACPPAVAGQVLARLTPLTPREADGRDCSIGEYLAFADALANLAKIEGWGNLRLLKERLLLQQNRTLHLLHDWTVRVMAFEQTPPHRWTSSLEGLQLEPRKGLWWIRNATGKSILEFALANRAPVVHKTWLARTVYDMLRISAELHARYNGKRTVAELLPTLESYRTVDPCSGQPYRWHAEKQWLYSVGVDKKDDGGLDRAQQKWQGTDYVLPCVVWLRPAK